MTGTTGILWTLLALFACERDSKLTALNRQKTDSAILDSGSPPPPSPSDDPDTAEEEPACPTHQLVIMPFDIWAAPLTVDWVFDTPDDWSEALSPWQGGHQIALDESSRLLNVELSAEDHRPLLLGINHDGTSDFDAITIDELYSGRATTAFMMVDDCPTTVVFGGLGHAFFADSAPAPSRNTLSFEIDGQEFWLAVAEDIENAEQRISWSTWWWESTFELIRSSDPSLDEIERYPNTIIGMFNSNTYVDKRLLLNRFWGESYDWLTVLYTDETMTDFAEQPSDFFEIMLVGNETDVPLTGELPDPEPQFSFTERIQENPTYAEFDFIVRDDHSPQDLDIPVYAASWHQKSMIFDGKIAYVSGFNTKQTDWDTRNHSLFDPRRTEYDASASDKQDIIDLENIAPLSPRADYGIRIEGPLVYDIEQHFSERWQEAIDDEVTYAENASSLPVLEPTLEISDGVLAQLNITTPTGDVSIFESHRNAISQAKQYIFIEDQYFRAPLLNAVIYDQMVAEPDLVLIVVTMSVDEYDPALKYTYLSHETFQADFPDRYLLLQLRNDALILRDNLFFDEVDYYNEPLYLHSKLRMIDDRYLSVGSCNMNNRGYKYEGEMNISILDDAFVQSVRSDILTDMVGEYSGYLSDDAENNFELLRLVSEENEIMADWWFNEGVDLSIDDALDEWAVYRPSGFVYPLDFSEDYIDIAGPDLF